jgi:xanthine permease XanP
VQGLERFAATPLVEFPHLPAPVLDVSPGMLAVIVMVTLLAQLDTFASVIIIDKMDDADWRRADMRMIARGIQANGIGNIVSGMIGGMPSGPSTANIGLCHATGATSRYIGILAALLIACVALLPRATLAITLIPTPVIGAINIYAAAFLIVSGLELAASRSLDDRGVFMIGISLTIGIGVMLMPELTTNVPASLHYIIGSGFVMAGLTAVVLNLLFRIGRSMRAQRTLDAATADINTAIIEFIEAQGGVWSVRRDIAHRAALAALEAAELITAMDGQRRPTAILARFDEYNLDIELLHDGTPLMLDRTQPPDPAHLLDADDGVLDIALAKVSGILLHGIADRVRSGKRPDCAYVLLHFDH